MRLKNWLKRLLGLVPPQPFPAMLPQNAHQKRQKMDNEHDGWELAGWGAATHYYPA